MIDKDLFKLLGGNKKYIFYAVAASLLGLFANLGITASICRAVKLATDGAEAAKYLPVALLALLAIALRYLASRLTAGFKDTIGRAVKKDLRRKIYDKTAELGTKSADTLSLAGLTQVSVEGVEQLDLYYSTYIPQFFYAMLAPMILFIISVFIDPKPALVLLACVPLIPMSIIMVSKWAKKIFAKYWDKYTSMGDYFLDSLQGMTELKIFKADARRQKEMGGIAEEFRQVTMKVLTMQLASTTIMDLVAYGGAGLGIALTIYDVWKNGLPIASALFLILVAVDFFLPLRAFGSAFHVAMNGVSAGKKIITLLETEAPAWGEKKVKSDDIELKDVTFSYDGEREALSNVSMRFPSRGMTAIVGESGCGKSTIVRLITGDRRPNSGVVTVGGDDESTLSRENFYTHIGAVSYDTYVFNETVRDNFRLAKKDVSDEEIKRALIQMNLWDFISQGEGLDKMISEDAGNLSGGQRQRLALAINLVADKPVYIFDEATSNIDIESEAIIMGAIKELSRTKNVIVISHRLENVVPSDNIYYMESGKVVESGSHEQLMDKNGGYAALYTKQKRLEKGYMEEATA